jgi:phosphoglycolate phosphatase
VGQHEGHGLGAVLFDLDGTLIDTAPDLTGALNELARTSGRPLVTEGAVRTVVSEGTRALLRLVFVDSNPPEARRQAFLAHYRQRLLCHSRPFAGIPRLLERLAAAELPWGIVTNKPGFLSRRVLAVHPTLRRCRCLISGDSTAYPKPHPEPLWAACRALGIPPERVVYVGDAAGDVDAARAAGLVSAAVAYGYAPPASVPADWGADACLPHVEALEAWLMDRLLGVGG